MSRWATSGSPRASSRPSHLGREPVFWGRALAPRQDRRHRRTCVRTFLTRSMLVVLLPLGLVGATSLADEKLPTDPALVMSPLPNGLTYIIPPHRNPEARVTIRLRVASGSRTEPA